MRSSLLREPIWERGNSVLVLFLDTNPSTDCLLHCAKTKKGLSDQRYIRPTFKILHTEDGEKMIGYEGKIILFSSNTTSYRSVNTSHKILSQV